jgi:hypothetical protein
MEKNENYLNKIIEDVVSEELKKRGFTKVLAFTKKSDIIAINGAIDELAGAGEIIGLRQNEDEMILSYRRYNAIIEMKLDPYGFIQKIIIY